MKSCFCFLIILLTALFIFAEEDVIGSDLENDDDAIEITDNEVPDVVEEAPDFSVEEDGAGISVTTSISGSTVVYGRTFYNYITEYSSGRIYVYDQVGETDEFTLSTQIPSYSEQSNLFGGFVAVSGDKLFTLNAIYGQGIANEQQLDIYKKNEETGWEFYKTVEPPENYEIAGSSGFIEDNGNILFSGYSNITRDKYVPQLFISSLDDDYTSFKSVIPENYDKDLYGFFFPKGFDISGDTIVATSTSQIDEFTIGPTSIHIFTRNTEDGTWKETQTIKSNQNERAKAFYRIAISGDRFIVQAFIDDSISTGSAQIFEKRDGLWEFVKELLPDNQVPQDHFGHNVSISGDFAAATDKGDSKSLPFGTTYIFYKDYDPLNPDTRTEGNWGLFKKYEVTEETPLMGSVVTLEGDILSMGAAPSILKGNNSLIPYIEKLEDPIFTDSDDETGDSDDSEIEDTEVNDNISENNDTDSTTEELPDIEENTNTDSSGCSILVF